VGKIAQKHFLVTVGDQRIQGTFSTKTGGETSGETTRDRDGGNPVADVIPGEVTVSNVTLGRAYKPERDQAVIKQLRPQVNRLKTSVTVQPLDHDYVPVGEPEVYVGCLLVRVAAPDADSNASETSRFELEFEPADVA
jgi:hypothetical protein